MRIDCQSYKKTLDNCLHIFGRTPPERAQDSVNDVSIGSGGVPVFVVCEYAIKYVYGPLPDLLRLRQTLVDFYRYSDIVEFE